MGKEGGSFLKLAFFGKYPSFPYFGIGGTNSLVRRLSIEMVSRHNIQVDHVAYGLRLEEEITHQTGLQSRHYRTLGASLEALKNYDHVITVYLPPRDLLTYMRFRTRYGSKIRFHMLHQSWPESAIKRNLIFALDSLVPFNGQTFSVSPRLMHHTQHYTNQAALLLPPVPTDYFIRLSEKPSSDKIRVTFLGRIDPGKGIPEVIKIFCTLADYHQVQPVVHGIFWEENSTAVELHNKLLHQNRFQYVPCKWTDYSNETEDMIRTVLKDTDILVLPYRRLSSTIDTPLLLLEAMASLCAVITKPYGNIPNIYGKSPCLMDNPDFIEKAVKIIASAKEWLPYERERIAHRTTSLVFDTASVTKHLVDTLRASKRFA
ncbi:glycosyltransferase [Chloroflexota bacterium]